MVSVRGLNAPVPVSFFFFSLFLVLLPKCEYAGVRVP